MIWYFLGVVQAISVKIIKPLFVTGVKTLSYPGYSSFEYVSLINSGLLVFLD